MSGSFEGSPGYRLGAANNVAMKRRPSVGRLDRWGMRSGSGAASFALWLLALFPDAAPRPLAIFRVVAITLALGVAVVRRGAWRLSLPAKFVLAALAVTVLGQLGRGLDIDSLSRLLVFVVPLIVLALYAPSVGSIGVERIHTAVLWIGVVQSGIAAIQWFTGGLRLWGWLGREGAEATFGHNQILGIGGRATGSTGHPILLATACAAALLVLVCARERRRAPALWALAAILCAGMAFSGTRSTVLVLTAVVLVGLLLGFVPRRLRLPVGAVLFAAVPAIVVAGPVRERLIDSLDGTVSLANRVDAWSVLRRLNARPAWEVLFGSGVTSTEDLRSRGLISLKFATDNGFVDVVAMSGWVGLALVIAVFLAGVKTSDACGRLLLLFLLGSFLAFDVVRWSFPFSVVVLLACAGTGSSGGVPAGRRRVPRLNSAAQRRAFAARHSV